MNAASIAQIGLRAVSPVFGLLMVGATTIGSHGAALGVGALAVIAVGMGTMFRPAATLAVLLVVSVMVASGPPPLLAALCGLSAAAYLVLRHGTGGPAGAVVTWPTIIATVGFTLAGLVATSFPLQLPWLPLLAPLAVFAIFLLATRPFLD